MVMIIPTLKYNSLLTKTQDFLKDPHHGTQVQFYMMSKREVEKINIIKFWPTR